MANQVNFSEPLEQQEELLPKKPLLTFNISNDRMEADLELSEQPESSGIIPPDYEEVMEAAAKEKLAYGFLEGEIKALCANPIIGKTYVIARGTPAQTGADGAIEYLVETERELRPKLRPDGTVDYRDLGLIRNVSAGQALCNIRHAEKGDDGKDVFGNVLEGRWGKEPAKINGKNTAYNEDETALLATVDGDVKVNRGMVSVDSLLKISGNVDNSTGDVDFVGDIHILGDVLAGFKVKSGGNISVKGTVEGAVVEAKGDIAIGGGINGMERGSVTAGGNIKTPFAQSCHLRAGQNIYADFIMYCRLEAIGNLELTGKRGVLVGGTSIIHNMLKATTIGTDSHISTQISMSNSDPELENRLTALQNRLRELDAEQLKLTQIVNRVIDLAQKGRATPDMIATVSTAKNTKAQLDSEQAITAKKLEEARTEQMRRNRENNCYIECKGRVHAGVVLTFGPLIMPVQSSFVFSRVSVVNDDISIVPLG